MLQAVKSGGVRLLRRWFADTWSLLPWGTCNLFVPLLALLGSLAGDAASGTVVLDWGPMCR